MTAADPLSHRSIGQRQDFNAAAVLARCGFRSCEEVRASLIKGKRLGGLDAIGSPANTGENISLTVNPSGAQFKPTA